MRVVGDRGVSTMVDGCPGPASSARGLRGGLGGSTLTRTKGLLDRGLSSSTLLPGQAKGLLGQLSDVRDDGSRVGNSIWGTEAAAAVG